MTEIEKTATGLGLAIIASDANGMPRLMQAFRPRAAFAGATGELAALDHLAALQSLWLQQATPMQLVNKGTQALRNGATIVRLEQQIDGIPVDEGELRVLLHQDSSLAAVGGAMQPFAVRPVFRSSPEAALEHALDQLYSRTRPRPAITDAGAQDGWHTLTVAAGTELRILETRARKVLAKDGGKLVEAWEIEVQGDSPTTSPSDPTLVDQVGRRFLVGDAGGKILSEVDLVRRDTFVARVYAETSGNRRPIDSPLEDFSPHPTGVPDGYTPTRFFPSRSIPLLAFNQPEDPWLPDDATSASGNNVVAFSDLDGTQTLTPGDIVPDVRAGRAFPFTYNPTLEALENESQIKAGAVNLFYLNNWMHNWWYDSGFTEITGNAQRSNLGRGGVENDPVVALAHAGAFNGSRDNATMLTPADGASPRMRIFVFSARVQTELFTPAGAVVSREFTALPHNFNLTRQIVAANDGVGNTNDGCQPITTDLTNRIALLTFAACGSSTPVNNAKARGAVGVVMMEPTSNNPRRFPGSFTARIPSLGIGKRDGDALQAAVAAGTVNVSLFAEAHGPERDGNLDNAVSGHEWGHYLHNRLAVCGNGLQCGGMSEGWGDFNALLMQLRPGDNREGTWSQGSYADADGTPDIAYFSIRRFPYSINQQKNPLRFRHIGDENPLPTTAPSNLNGLPNSEVHNSGEVWTSLLFEAFNVLIDTHGEDSTGIAIARRRMSDYAVAGLLLTPPNATFIEGRDAILAAAGALDTDDMLLMAAAFAGRGAGTCAVGPASGTPGNVGVVESGTVSGKLTLSQVSLTDDGVSCDQDGVLDPGETGSLRVTVANTGVLAAENVQITASTTTPGFRFGAPIRFALMQPFEGTSLQIPVTVLPTAPRNTNVTITVRATGSPICDRDGVIATLNLRIGVDEVTNASRVDNVETARTAWTATGSRAGELWTREADPNTNHFWFGANAPFQSDTQLVSPPLQVSTTEPFIFKFRHAFDFDDPLLGFDGGVVEIATGDDTTWVDVTTLGANPSYNGVITDSENVLSNRPGYVQSSAGFPMRNQVTMSFGTLLAGQTVRLRFRLGTDSIISQIGWEIDDIEVSGTTNTPFPALIAEPSTCTARSTIGESSVLAQYPPVVRSLAAADLQACVANDIE